MRVIGNENEDPGEWAKRHFRQAYVARRRELIAESGLPPDVQQDWKMAGCLADEWLTLVSGLNATIDAEAAQLSGKTTADEFVPIFIKRVKELKRYDE